jgi:metal-dependent hydrolase (beta-lactamase superfamily II)
MPETPPLLKPVDRLEITILVDNSIDVFLPSTAQVQRAQIPTNLPWGERDVLISEHGYSALVRVQVADRSASLLFDAGVSTHALIHNMDVLEIRPQDLHSIVLSHGHIDHTQGLLGMVKRLGKRRMPLLLHPDAFLIAKSFSLMITNCTRLRPTVAFWNRKISSSLRSEVVPICSMGWCWLPGRSIARLNSRRDFPFTIPRLTGPGNAIH